MPNSKAMKLTRKYLAKLDEDRRDNELATSVLRAGEQTYPLEQVMRELHINARTRHRKPRKID